MDVYEYHRRLENMNPWRDTPRREWIDEIGPGLMKKRMDAERVESFDKTRCARAGQAEDQKR
jgi:hypothetical protein